MSEREPDKWDEVAKQLMCHEVRDGYSNVWAEGVCNDVAELATALRAAYREGMERGLVAVEDRIMAVTECAGGPFRVWNTDLKHIAQSAIRAEITKGGRDGQEDKA